MPESCRRTLILCGAMVVLATTAWSLSPVEQYENGRRAFLLGHWDDAYHLFQEFLDLWSGHALAPKARYHSVLADIRRQHEEAKAQVTARIASWTQIVPLLKKDLPGIDLTEITAAIDLEQSRLADSSLSWETLAKVPVAQMAQILQRRWYPDPTAHPLATLGAINDWLAANRATAPSLLQGHLALLQAKALWRVYVSPLAMNSLEAPLQAQQAWPVDKALGQLLRRAFHAGDPDIRREAALLGVSLEAILMKQPNRRKPPQISTWQRYLQERGIHAEEAFFPR